MVELARELRAAGDRVGVISNSEGRLAEHLADIGIADAFEIIVDSGVLGIDKPDRRIFDHALARLGGSEARIHIGDSWAADVCGAVDAGWRAVWFGPRAKAVADPRITVARDAAELRAVLSIG
jgi:putative hydrolase of the HAD superfamily